MGLTIEEISDRLEINDLYSRYVHAADDHDTAALDLIFLPHTTFDWSSTGGGKMTYLEAREGPAFRGDLFRGHSTSAPTSESTWVAMGSRPASNRKRCVRWGVRVSAPDVPSCSRCRGVILTSWRGWREAGGF